MNEVFTGPGPNRNEPIRQAVILAGGRGTRLGALTDRLPKGLIRVAGRPFLEHLLLYLEKQGISRILLCVGYLGEMIEDYFGSGSWRGLEIEYSREEKPLGTGGALNPARDRLEDEFFLLNGDTFLPADYRRLERGFDRAGARMLLGAFPGPGPDARPNLRIDREMRVSAVRLPGEETKFTHLDAGVRAARKSIVDFFPAEEVFSLEADLYPRLAAAGELAALEVRECFYDIGTPKRLRIFAEYLTSPGTGS